MKIKVYTSSYSGVPAMQTKFYKKIKDLKKAMDEKFGQELIWKDGDGFSVELGFRSEKDYETSMFGTIHNPVINAICSIYEIELEIIE